MELQIPEGARLPKAASAARDRIARGAAPTEAQARALRLAAKKIAGGFTFDDGRCWRRAAAREQFALPSPLCEHYRDARDLEALPFMRKNKGRVIGVAGKGAYAIALHVEHRNGNLIMRVVPIKRKQGQRGICAGSIRMSDEDKVRFGEKMAHRAHRALPGLVPAIVHASSDGAHTRVQVFERADGQTLFQLLPRNANNAKATKLEGAFRAAGEAISSLHGAGIVHGDYHPGNVMWDGTSVSIIDFEYATPIPFHAAITAREARTFDVRMFVAMLYRARAGAIGEAAARRLATAFIEGYCKQKTRRRTLIAQLVDPPLSGTTDRVMSVYNRRYKRYFRTLLG